MRVCSRCKIKKNLEEFRKNSSKKLGRTYACSECLKQNWKKIQLENPEKHRTAGRKWKENNKEKFRAYSREYHRTKKDSDPERYYLQARNSHLKGKYGIGLVEFNQLLINQNYLCIICEQEEYDKVNLKINNLYVDHNHTSKEVRGLLCRSCNSLLGFAKEDTDVLRLATCYIQNYKTWGAYCKYYESQIKVTVEPKFEKTNEYAWKSRYGISKEDYLNLWNGQNGKCALCKQISNLLSVDHCHKTNEVRGLLCKNCNLLLGHGKDDEKILASAIEYLEFHSIVAVKQKDTVKSLKAVNSAG